MNTCAAHAFLLFDSSCMGQNRIHGNGTDTPFLDSFSIKENSIDAGYPSNHHDITILLGPEKNYPCQKELHISRRLLKHPMTPIPWLKLPFCLQMKILFPPQARPFFWCLTVVPTRFSTPRTSRASLRTGKSSPRTGDSWSLEAMITGDVASH